MNENANEQGSVTGRALGTTLGIAGSLALGGAGILMGSKAIGKIGRGTSKNAAKTVAKNVRGTRSEYLQKNYKSMVETLKKNS